MARKYNLISELYDRTCKTVVANPQNWQNFLQSACRNYKLRYDEQLLIYAQRPDATAVLEIERWNRNFGRWVNRGARGIAVFADEDRKTQRLSHYFDISDTHEGRYSRPVPLWDMQEEYTEAVIETLENEIEQKDIFELLHRRRKKSSTIFCSQYGFEEWYDQLGGDDSPLADAIIDRIAHDSYRINITSIDAEHDISMREVYGLDKMLRE